MMMHYVRWKNLKQLKAETKHYTYKGLFTPWSCSLKKISDLTLSVKLDLRNK